MATAKAYIYFPPVQPMRFTDPYKGIPAAYNLPHLDEYPQRKSILPFQQDPNIATKVQYDDTTWIQFHHNLYSWDVRILNSDGDIVYTTETYAPIFRGVATIAGNVYDAHGTVPPVQLYTGTVKINWKDLPTLIDGRIYFIEIIIYTNTAKTAYVSRQSEPLLYKTKHKDTFRVDYAHASNDFGVFWNFQDITSIFNRWNITFQLRLDGYIEALQMEGTDVFYTDQMTDLRQLNARPYRKQTLFVGQGYGVVDYQIEKLWRAFACSYTAIDGKRFGKEENAKLDIAQKDHESSKQCSLVLREYWSADAGFVNGSYETFETVPPDGGTWDPSSPGIPFMVFPSGREIRLSDITLILDDSAGTAYELILNHSIWGGNPDDLEQGEILPYPLGLYGEFVYRTDSNLMSYEPDDRDEFRPTFRFVSKERTYLHTVTSVDQTGGDYTLKFRGGDFIIDWGDGSGLQEVYYDSSGSLQAVSHTYPSGTTDYPIVIYHDGTGIEELQLKSGELVITALGGTAPRSLLAFSIEDGDFGPEFDFGWLDDCGENLQSITVKNCGISLISITTFDTGIWKGGFSYVNFSRNALDHESMDTFISDLVQYPSLLANGTLDLRGQDPIDYVTSASEYARGILTGFKWTLELDQPE